MEDDPKTNILNFYKKVRQLTEIARDRHEAYEAYIKNATSDTFLSLSSRRTNICFAPVIGVDMVSGDSISDAKEAIINAPDDNIRSDDATFVSPFDRNDDIHVAEVAAPMNEDTFNETSHITELMGDIFDPTVTQLSQIEGVVIHPPALPSPSTPTRRLDEIIDSSININDSNNASSPAIATDSSNTPILSRERTNTPPQKIMQHILRFTLRQRTLPGLPTYFKRTWCRFISLHSCLSESEWIRKFSF